VELLQKPALLQECFTSGYGFVQICDLLAKQIALGIQLVNYLVEVRVPFVALAKINFPLALTPALFHPAIRKQYPGFLLLTCVGSTKVKCLSFGHSSSAYWSASRIMSDERCSLSFLKIEQFTPI